ncbi:SH3 domain-containing protein [Tenacibaculum ovolyticum]|uniref:hypothetical protein n=1 Tax=Tenacibaculum ovolyticum TaxID=104270 RepID=UPI00048F6799|nr:hypothetical protein [Tenacibaculum ovolyticum]
MKNIIRLICLLFICSSCSITSNLYEAQEEFVLYSQKSKDSDKIIIVPKGESVRVIRGKGYRRIKYKNMYGWSYNPYIKKKYTYHDFSNYSGSVSVKGYYRKDGTYVRPHSRSYPKAKKYKYRKSYKRRKRYRKKRY